MTNYERITESPKKLAEFLEKMSSSTGCCIIMDVLELRQTCGQTHELDARCPYDEGNCSFNTLEWLQEECND